MYVRILTIFIGSITVLINHFFVAETYIIYLVKKLYKKLKKIHLIIF